MQPVDVQHGRTQREPGSHGASPQFVTLIDASDPAAASDAGDASGRPQSISVHCSAPDAEHAH